MDKYFKLLKNNLLFSKDCLPFTIIIIIFVIFCSLVFTRVLYFSHLTSNKQKLMMAVNTIDSMLSQEFSEAQQLMVYIGKEISAHESDNLKFIEKTLKNNYQHISKNKGIISDPMFNWVNSENRMIIFRTGLNSYNSIDVSNRSYSSLCHQNPWQLQVCRPSVSQHSGLWVIPVALGITNKNDEYMGALVTGIEVFKISNKIQQVLDSNKISFIVLDQELRIIVQSTDNSIDPKSSFYQDTLRDFNYFPLRKGKLKDAIEYKTLQYFFYKKVSKYPYIILAGFDKNQLLQGFLSKILFHLIELWGMGLFCLTLLYFFRKKFLKRSYESEKSRDKFLRQINTEAQNKLTSILTHSDVLLKHLKGKIAIGISRDKHIEFMNTIYETSCHLYSLMTSGVSNDPTTTGFAYINVNSTIEECINIHYHSIVMKGITLTTNLKPNIENLHADELRFKQIIIGLLSLAMEYTPQGGTIKVSTCLKEHHERYFLELCVEDNGFGLEKDDIHRIDDNKAGSFDLELSTIEKLIKIHRGTYRLDSTWPFGKKFTVHLPYITEEKNDSAHFGPMGSSNNVVVFPNQKNR